MPIVSPIIEQRLGTFARFAAEPFRIFFPIAVLAGLIGVALWPLHLLGLVQWYPGQSHARLMANGFFGGFIFGFLGTAMPRMLSARPLRSLETALLAIFHVALIASYSVAANTFGDAMMLCVIAAFATCIGLRLSTRKDIPPPGFVLVGLGLLCAFGGVVLSILLTFFEMDLFWTNLQRVLLFQGAILLPIMGVAPFILPRFFGLRSSHDLPESIVPNKVWRRKALLAAVAGILTVVSFLFEAAGSFQLAYALRFGIVLTYSLLEIPWSVAPGATHSLGVFIRTAYAGIIGGFLAVAILPQYRVGLLHITLMGGFALITFIVATRVVLGHSGRIQKLLNPSRWLYALLGLMLLAMATRVSGDLWPAIMATHYIYGAILWIIVVLVWSTLVLPNVRNFETE